MLNITISDCIIVRVSEETADFCWLSDEAVALWDRLEEERAALCAIGNLWDIPWCEDWSDYIYYSQAREISSTYEGMDMWLDDKYGTWEYMDYMRM